jgi:hypothetical protein
MNTIRARLASVVVALVLILCYPLALNSLGAVFVELLVLLLNLVLTLLCLSASAGTVV